MPQQPDNSLVKACFGLTVWARVLNRTSDSLLLLVTGAFLVTGCELDEFLAPDPVMYVGDRPYPMAFDPL